MAAALALEPRIEQLARDLAKCRDGSISPRHQLSLALEGALKLKEISYIHAEDMRGRTQARPIALIDEPCRCGDRAL